MGFGSKIINWQPGVFSQIKQWCSGSKNETDQSEVTPKSYIGIGCANHKELSNTPIKIEIIQSWVEGEKLPEKLQEGLKRAIDLPGWEVNGIKKQKLVTTHRCLCHASGYYTTIGNSPEEVNIEMGSSRCFQKHIIICPFSRAELKILIQANQAHLAFASYIEPYVLENKADDICRQQHDFDNPPSYEYLLEKDPTCKPTANPKFNEQATRTVIESLQNDQNVQVETDEKIETIESSTPDQEDLDTSCRFL